MAFERAKLNSATLLVFAALHAAVTCSVIAFLRRAQKVMFRVGDIQL